MKKINQKNLKKIMFILAVILLVLLIILSITIRINSKKKNIKNENLGSVKVDITEQSTEVKNFDNIVDKLPIKSITMRERVQDFCIYFLKSVHLDIENKSEKQIEEYYNQNKNIIDGYLYNSNLENFKNVVSKLQEIKEKTLKYTNNEFIDISFNDSNKKDKFFDMKVQYNKKYEIEVTVHILDDNESIEKNEIYFEVK